MKSLKSFSFAAYVAMIFAVACLLIACGDDSSSNSSSNNEGRVADECSDELQQARVFLMKTQTYYVCVDGKLVSVDATVSSSSVKAKSSSGTKSKSSSSVKAKSSSSVKAKSSSSTKAKSSSSVKASSSANVKVNSSSSVKSQPSSSAKSQSSSSAKPKSSSSVKTSAVSSSSVKATAKSSSSIHITLWSCDEDQEGSYIYLEDTKQYFVCKNSEWKETAKADLDLDKIHCTGTSKDSVSCFVDVSSSSVESSSSVKAFDRDVGATFTDARDNQVYKQVVIGDQLWMAQNLNYKTPFSVCPEDSVGSYCKEYGRLYPYDDGDYNVVLNDDLCPAGWGIPSEDQWAVLLKYVAAHNGGGGVGKSLKSKDGWFAAGTVVEPENDLPRTAVASGEDLFGFTALPAGSRWGSCIYTHDETRFWGRATKTKLDDFHKGPFLYIGYKLSYDSDEVTLDSSSFASNGFSIRCISVNYFVGIREGYCTEERDGDMLNVEGELVVCDKGNWRYADIRESTLGICHDELEGKSKVFLDSSLNRYGDDALEFYTCEKGSWREAVEKEMFAAVTEMRYGACSDNYYNKQVFASYYDKAKRGYASIHMICDTDGWRESSLMEESLGLCYAKIEGNVQPYSYGYPQPYAICEKGAWRDATLQEEMDFLYGNCSAKIQDSMVIRRNDNAYYLCDKNDWRKATVQEEISYFYGKCSAILQDSVAYYGRGGSYYLCDKSAWREISSEENMKGLKCTKDAKILKGNYYGNFVCDADSLRFTKSIENKVKKGCTSYNEGDSLFISQTGVTYEYYKCLDVDESWKLFTAIDSTAFGKFTDERDGQSYRTIKIGEKTWFADNLNYKTDSSFCYNDSLSNCKSYGRLYNFSAAQKACPSGWHLPDLDEWLSLPDTTDKIRSLKDFAWNGSNEYGFSALPGGYSDGKSYYGAGDLSEWWTSSDISASEGFAFGVASGHRAAGEFYFSYRFSVRCVLGAVADTSSVVDPKLDSTKVVDP